MAAPHRHGDHAHPRPADAPGGVPAPEAFRAWLPLVGASVDEQTALFAQNSAGLKTDFRQVTSLEEAHHLVAALARENQWQRVASHQTAVTSGLAGKVGLPFLFTDSGYDKAELERCDAAITGCDALVAQTGSILVTNKSAGGRALSVLPPHHVVLARRGQMLPDLGAALRLVRETYAPNWPSFVSFITGPSRTGDIERILVLGAHGPKKLTVIFIS